MSEKEIKDIWNGSGEEEQINLDLPQLETNLKTKSKKMDRSLFWRDTREVFASAVVVIIFGYKAITESLVITRVTSVLFVIWAIYGAYRILDVRKYKRIIDISNSFKAQLQQQKVYLEQQAHLLDSIWSWYLGPFVLILTIAIIGKSYEGDLLGIFNTSTIINLAIGYLISWGIYALNKRAAKTAFVPLIENIDNVLIQLNEDSI